ncbi:MAG TPA: hypothetical protein VG245_03675, partial [Candidatus Dormibacteraeota bacterium]|nr:hypothetical protein [Candidatus Dormibacteraeota bacterium]
MDLKHAAGAAGLALAMGVSMSTAEAAPAAGPPLRPTGGISFGRETLADPFRLGFEPGLQVSQDGTVYETPIFGFVTTQAFIERSDDGGQTFNTLGLPGVGKTTPCSGGGDIDVATTPVNDIYFGDLGYAPEVPVGLSSDHGNTFVPSCLSNLVVAVGSFADRQWMTTDTVHGREWLIYRDGLLTPGTPVDQAFYGEHIKYATYATTPGSAGATQIAFSDLCTTGGVGVACMTDVQVAGAPITDNTGSGRGNTYLPMRANNNLEVAVINPDAATTVVERVVLAGADAVLFPTVAADRAGNLYFAWVNPPDPTKPNKPGYQLNYTTSQDQGRTWSTPVTVNGAPVRTAIMPWLAAGDTGRVDLAFYGSPVADVPDNNFGPWNLYMEQTLNGLSPNPTWSQALATDRPNHVDAVCQQGLFCSTVSGPQGDRQLGDFFKVNLDASGRALIAFDDGNNQLGDLAAGGPLAEPSFAAMVRQATGPSLYSAVGQVPAIPVPTNSSSRPDHQNPVPFVSPAGPGPSVDALNLQSSAISRTPDGSIKVTLKVKNLDAVGAVTPPALPVATYLTRWWFGGKIYFASAEDVGGASWSYFAGEAAPVQDGDGIKYAYYPDFTAATGT